MKPTELAANGFTKVKTGFKKIKIKKKFVIIAVILALIIALCIFFALRNKPAENAEAADYTTTTVQRGSITETIEQSGVVEPYERREITSLAKGEIIASPFEEGDYVEEGQTLYRIDDEDAQINIEKASISLEETNDSINDLYIYAPASGTLSDFTLQEGENAQSGVIGYITDTDVLTVDIPFTSADFDKISVGDSVNVTSSLYMTSLPGVVTHKYNGTLYTTSDGSAVKNIEVEINNPGAFATGTTVAATVNTASGDVYSTGSGTIESGGRVSVNCEVQGAKVSSVNFKSGDKVEKGELIAVLDSDSLYNTRRSNELNLESSQKALEDYNITAPISGTIITKTSKLGDKIDNSNAQTVMMVIADMSKMKFTISVDELDIAKIQLGQKVIVDADAIENQTFEGRITNVAAEGTSSGDGVTTYEVEIVIDQPGELKPGMNVNANIVINEAEDALYIPEEALMMASGNTASVLVKSESGSQNGGESSGERPEGGGQGQPPTGAEPPQSSESGEQGVPENAASGREAAQDISANGESSGMPQGSGGQNGGITIPDGYEIKQVETGVSDGTNIEIISGLSEGEEIIYIPQTASAGDDFMRMMMGGGPSGGGGPEGGPGGGAPGGGR